MNDVTQQFLKDTEREDSIDILEQPITPDGSEEQPSEDTPEAPEVDVDNDDDEDVGKVSPKTRRERRLVRKLEAERESSRQMAEKLQTFSAAAKNVEDAEYLKGIERIYGTDSPEAQMATELLRNALVGIRKDAEESAYNRVKSEREQELQVEREKQQQLESYLDEVEDHYNVSLTESQEKGFIKLLEKMSPKDNSGKVLAYADPITVYELYKDRSSTNRQTPQRAKTVANRSLNQGSTPEDSKIQDDSNVRFLRENGII